MIIHNYYYFKLLNLFSSIKAHSKENFCKPRGPQPTYYYIVVIIVEGMKMHPRKEGHWRITKTPKRGVTSRN